MEPKELLEKAIAAVGEVRLAEMLGYKFATAARTYARWQSGKEPSYQHTLTLLDAAGLLRGSEEPARMLLDELRCLETRDVHQCWPFVHVALTARGLNGRWAPRN